MRKKVLSKEIKRKGVFQHNVQIFVLHLSLNEHVHSILNVYFFC